MEGVPQLPPQPDRLSPSRLRLRPAVDEPELGRQVVQDLGPAPGVEPDPVAGCQRTAQVLGKPDWPAKLAGVEAAAAGASLEPEPKLTAAVRGGDAATVGELLGGLNLEAQGEWRVGERAGARVVP